MPVWAAGVLGIPAGEALLLRFAQRYSPEPPHRHHNTPPASQHPPPGIPAARCTWFEVHLRLRAKSLIRQQRGTKADHNCSEQSDLRPVFALRLHLAICRRCVVRISRPAVREKPSARTFRGLLAQSEQSAELQAMALHPDWANRYVVLVMSCHEAGQLSMNR